MSCRAKILGGVLVVVFLSAAMALSAPGERLHLADRAKVVHGGGSSAAKAGRDTFLLMGPTGSGAPFIGDFEDGAKALDVPVNGWTSIDFTRPPVNHWHLSDYVGLGPLGGAQWAWCGDAAIPSCDGGATDPAGGYGNNWRDMLEWRQTVASNTQSTTLGITATANIDSEPGFDGTTLLAEKNGFGLVQVNHWDGVSAALAISETVTYLPGEYMGPGSDEVVLIWRFESDTGWSDEDCSFPTSGGIQLDDVTITSNNGAGMALQDFETDFGEFTLRGDLGVGDFAKIWTHLGDADPCATNNSRQVAFIDDGLVVPGTGGTTCQSWCYGPGGFIVNNTGGLLGSAAFLHNAIVSPVMPWPDPAHRGGLLTFGVYRHELLGEGSPGIFYTWHVRSTDTGLPGDLDTAPWENRRFVQFGGPGYLHQDEVVDDLLVTGPTHVQIRLAVYELGWVWGFVGSDGTPAPYFDNVRFETYPTSGPALSVREVDMAQDGFPENGTIDMGDPGSLWVRFDMCQNISPSSHLHRDFGDSLAITCLTRRPGTVLDGFPRMVYKVQTNPVFDPYRTHPLPYEGAVDCPLYSSPYDIFDRYFADLPDSNWLFPGDIVHYYFEATDIDTETMTTETATMPADLDGYGEFWDPLAYDPAFVFHALPTITDLSGSQPPVLFWSDAGDLGRDEWHTSFFQIAVYPQLSYDIYYTNAPSSGVGNGLGTKASAAQLAGYHQLLYTSGNLTHSTIANGDLADDGSEDIQTLTAWLDGGQKHAFLTGDNLAADLSVSGPATSGFLGASMGVTYVASDLRDLIAGQMAPRVLITGMNPVFFSVSSWIAYGGCPGLNTFDAVTTAGGGQRLAVYADPSGVDGLYPYTAATLASGVGSAGTSEVFSLPYDFSAVRTDPGEIGKADARLAGRTRLLQNVLLRFGFFPGPIEPSPVLPGADALAAAAAPNPFNPVTTISYNAPRAGDLSLKIYNVRGELVRTLVSGFVTRGPHAIAWHGDDDRGARMASGVYFYEVRQGADVVVNKLALVK